MRHYSLVSSFLVAYLFCYPAQAESIVEAAQKAVEKASLFKAENEALTSLKEKLELDIVNLRADLNNKIQQISSLTTERDGWKQKHLNTDVLKQIVVEAGEYNRKYPFVGIRIDPRNTTINTIASTHCSGTGSPRIRQLSSSSGGCCGYTYWAVSCLGRK